MNLRLRFYKNSIAIKTSPGEIGIYSRGGFYVFHYTSLKHNRYIYVYSNNKWSIVTWCESEEAHREDGPARFYFDSQRNLYCIEWYRKGVLHREDGPALVRFRPWEPNRGQIDFEQWYRSGDLHREDGPAVIVHDIGSKPVRAEWYCQDHLHREDGPAVVCHLSSWIRTWHGRRARQDNAGIEDKDCTLVEYWERGRKLGHHYVPGNRVSEFL